MSEYDYTVSFIADYVIVSTIVITDIDIDREADNLNGESNEEVIIRQASTFVLEQYGFNPNEWANEIEVEK